MIGRFVEVCKRRSLKVNADEIKLKVFGGKKGSKCKVNIEHGWGV